MPAHARVRADRRLVRVRRARRAEVDVPDGARREVGADGVGPRLRALRCARAGGEDEGEEDEREEARRHAVSFRARGADHDRE